MRTARSFRIRKSARSMAPKARSKSGSGIPGLGQIPLFRYLFAQQKKTRDENEIVFVMVPHIVRHQDLTPLNTRAIDIGAGSSISLRRGQPAPTPVSAPVPPPAQPQTN